MVVTQKQFHDLKVELNDILERLDKRLKEIEKETKTTPKGKGKGAQGA